MSDCFLGEIRLFSFNYPPKGWALCNGSTLPVGQNQALYSLLGTYFGGDGRTTFGLPDLRGRTPVHSNQSIGGNSRIVTEQVGSRDGADSVSLTAAQAPRHDHAISATTATGALLRFATTASGVTYSGIPAKPKNIGTNPSPTPIYAPQPAQPSGMAAMAPGMVTPMSAAHPHENRQPYLAGYYCISLSGLYPPRP